MVNILDIIYIREAIRSMLGIIQMDQKKIILMNSDFKMINK